MNQLWPLQQSFSSLKLISNFVFYTQSTSTAVSGQTRCSYKLSFAVWSLSVVAKADHWLGSQFMLWSSGQPLFTAKSSDLQEVEGETASTEDMFIFELPRGSIRGCCGTLLIPQLQEQK